jgi:hypothetical protein
MVLKDLESGSYEDRNWERWEFEMANFEDGGLYLF